MDAFSQWCKDQSIWIDSRIAIRKSTVTTSGTQGETGETGHSVLSCGGIGVFALAPIPSGETLVKIPKTAIFSTRMSSLFQSGAVSRKDPHLELALALLAEWLDGEENSWWGYLQSLPWHDPPPLALFWSEADVSPNGGRALEIATGSELRRLHRRTAIKILADIKDYYSSTVEPLLQYKFGTKFNKSNGLKMYQVSYALVSSRAFVVDAWHGLSMVPIADAFNHTEDNTICLHTEHDVCYICGELYDCPHDTPPSSPMLQQGIRSLGPDTADMIACQPHSPGDEIFNTYSHSKPLSNAQLLLQYGFMEDGNSADRIVFDVSELNDVVDETVGTHTAEDLAIDSDGEPSAQLMQILQHPSASDPHKDSDLLLCERLPKLCQNRLDAMIYSGDVENLMEALVASPYLLSDSHIPYVCRRIPN